MRKQKVIPSFKNIQKLFSEHKMWKKQQQQCRTTSESHTVAEKNGVWIFFSFFLSFSFLFYLSPAISSQQIELFFQTEIQDDMDVMGSKISSGFHLIYKCRLRFQCLLNVPDDPFNVFCSKKLLVKNRRMEQFANARCRGNCIKVCLM